MDIEKVKQCSYNQLRQIALEHGILKSSKSKKKAVLLERIINYISQNEGGVLEETTPQLDNGNKENVPDEADVPIHKGRRRKTRNTKSKSSSSPEEAVQSSNGSDEGEVLDKTMPEPDASNKENSLGEINVPVSKGRQRKTRKAKATSNPKLDETFNISSDRSGDSRVLEEMVPELDTSNKKNKSLEEAPVNKGRNKKTKKAKTTNSPNSEETLNFSSDKSDEDGTRKVTSPEMDIANKNTPEEPDLPTHKGRQRKGRKAKSTNSPKEEEVLHSSSHRSVEDRPIKQTTPETDNEIKESNLGETEVAPRKGRKRKATKAKVESSPAKNIKITETTLQSSDIAGEQETSLEIANDPVENSAGDSAENQKRGNRSQSKVSKADLKCLKAANLPEGPVSAANRRGTFSVSSQSSLESRTTKQCSVLGEGTIPVADRRDTFLVSFDSPSNERTTRVSNTSGKGAVPAADRRGTFSITSRTPLSERKIGQSRTPGKSLVPNSEKKVIFSPSLSKSLKKQSSTPASKLHLTGTFSAKKMPNFSKIHQKNFDKMESLVSYSTRKLARRELLSPLNKTYTDTGRKEVQTKKMRNSTECQASKSLIPVRAARIRLDEKKKITAFANKTRVTNVEAIRERDRDFLKGVRTNKRFMLQMKMRKIDA